MNKNSDKNISTENRTPVNRRKLLTGTAVGVVAGLTLPEKWARPMVKSLTLPAHANTSGCVGEISAGLDPEMEPNSIEASLRILAIIPDICCFDSEFDDCDVNITVSIPARNIEFVIDDGCGEEEFSSVVGQPFEIIWISDTDSSPGADNTCEIDHMINFSSTGEENNVPDNAVIQDGDRIEVTLDYDCGFSCSLRGEFDGDWETFW